MNLRVHYPIPPTTGQVLRGLLSVAIACFLFVAACKLAFGHGPAELASEDVAVTAAGYLVKSLKETIPFSEAQPSPDGHYWRCAWGHAQVLLRAPEWILIMTGFAIFSFAATFAGGYAAAIYTWDKLKVWFSGAETEIRALEDKIKALRAKL